MNIPLSDKTIVITGASRGLGRCMAEALGREGANVVINYNNSVNEANQLKAYLDGLGVECMLVKADVRNEQEVRKMCKVVIWKYGKLDVLINNAGICQDELTTHMNIGDWQNVIDTNLTSVFLCSKYFSKEMIKSRQGKILNISSYKGISGSIAQANYSTSKAGIIAFTKTLAKELSQFNISVNAICPGFIVTDLNQSNRKKMLIAQQQSLMDINNNLSDLIAFVTLICSDNLKSVTGQVFNIDSRF
jgi:3-oxoacyl-[acyl-carrier protein] reductase